MSDLDRGEGLLPALLKFWRRQRGMSQLDLAIAADVSARHVSFLETGRATPSADMVVRLATALDVPLRQVNALLRSVGHPPAYPEGTSLPPVASIAVDHLKRHAEPFPLIVVDRGYAVVDANLAAHRLVGMLLGGAADLVGLNLLRATFDPQGAQPFIANFDEVGRSLLWRLYREVLDRPDDPQVRDLLAELVQMSTVRDGWRAVDLSAPSDPALTLNLRVGQSELRFVTLVTTFQAPQNVVLDELRMEHWLPTDEPTAALCRQLATTG